jgi:hypothetical protein
MALLLVTGELHAEGLQCRHLLLSSPSQKDVDVTLDRLAELRFQIDMNQSDGNRSMAAKKLKLDFEHRYQDLVARLNDQKSEQEIRDMLVSRIRTKQGLHEELTSKEIVQREQNEKSFNNLYANTERIDLPTGVSSIRKGYYRSETDSMLLQMHRSLVDCSLHNRKVKRIAEDVRDFVVTDDKILVHTDAHEVFRYDIQGNNKTQLLKNLNFDKELSPGAKYIAVKKRDKVLFFDANTEAPLTHSFQEWAAPEQPKQGFLKSLFAKKTPPPAPGPEHSIGTITFITEDFVKIEGFKENNIDREFVLFQISTGRTFPLNFMKDILWQIVFNEQNQTFLFVQYNQIAAVKVSELSRLANEDVFQVSKPMLLSGINNSGWKYGITLLHDNNILVRRGGEEAGSSAKMAQFSFDFQLFQNFRFESHGEVFVYRPIFDIENERMFEIGYYNGKTISQDRYFIDVWKKNSFTGGRQ